MSAEATFWAWRQQVASSQKLVLLALANCHNESTGQCNPSVEYIADTTGLNRKTVMSSLADLEKRGLISPVKSLGRGSQYRLETSTYFGTGCDGKGGTKNGTGASTKNGTGTKNGTSTKNGTRTSTNFGTTPVPILGHESKKNLKENLKDYLPSPAVEADKIESEAPAETRPPSPPEKPMQARRTKTRLPDDFVLTDELRKAALAYWLDPRRNRADLDASDEFDRFSAHHRSRGTTMLDWGAAWQTWYSNAVKFNQPRGAAHAGNTQPGQPYSLPDRVRANNAARAAEREAALSRQGQTFDGDGNLVGEVC